jgi:hypothetical protein
MYFCFLVRLVGGVEKGRNLSGRRFHEVVDFVQSTYVSSLVLKSSDRFKGSTTTILALGRWSLGARVQKLLDCHQQCQADSDMEATTTTHRRLAQRTSMYFLLFLDCLVLMK